jgi:hypothetical protein
MSAPQINSIETGVDLSDGMADEIERVRESIAVELRRAGVRLPDAGIAAVAEVVLAGAVRISLRWLNDG